MTSPSSAGAASITSLRVIAIAAPIVLSNATVPLQGLIDTALIGRLGEVTPLAAVDLGATLFALLLASFNFLQIATSGLSAQALGRRDGAEAALLLARALTLAATIAVLLLVAQRPILWAGLGLFDAGPGTDALTTDYFDGRIWGAPAELMNYALLGWFAGQEMTRRLFQHQLVLTGTNIALNILFVNGFGWGVAGVALGTAIASYVGLAYGLWLARARLRALSRMDDGDDPIAALGWRRVLDWPAIALLMAMNRDLFIRTLLLVGAFAWMRRLGAQQDAATLAANGVLFQFFLVTAYALDGFAIAAETLVGQARGARDAAMLDRAVWMTTVWAVGLSALAAGVLLLSSHALIDFITTSEEVRTLARQYAPWAALIPLAGVLAFQMDGVFVGATASVEMRNTMIIASLAYYPGAALAVELFGNHGLWAAVWLWLLLRGGMLLALYPRIRTRTALAD